jgi:hypothetical protein
MTIDQPPTFYFSSCWLQTARITPIVWLWKTESTELIKIDQPWDKPLSLLLISQFIDDVNTDTIVNNQGTRHTHISFGHLIAHSASFQSV